MIKAETKRKKDQQKKPREKKQKRSAETIRMKRMKSGAMQDLGLGTTNTTKNQKDQRKTHKKQDTKTNSIKNIRLQ